MTIRTHARTVLAVLAVLLAALAGVTITTGDNDHPAPRTAQTVRLDGPDPGIRPDVAVTVTPAAAQHVATARTKGELGGPLREPTDPSRTPPGHLEGPLAAQEFPGCRTRNVQNFSSRNGVRPQIIVWHQTVSRERGWASQDALTAMANQRSSGVSWAFLIGRAGGRCTYSVPLNMKAWTQANANPFSVGIEVEAYGDEPTYVTGAGERKLLAVTREIGRREGIPMRRGEVRNCRVIRSGIVEHSDLGSCGGGHDDVTPWPTAALVAKLKPRPVGTSADRVLCRKLNAYRARRKVAGRQALANAIARRKALERKGLHCNRDGTLARR